MQTRNGSLVEGSHNREAHMAYQCLTHEIPETFNLAKAAFKPSSKQVYYEVEFKKREKLDKEDWADLGDELLMKSIKTFQKKQGSSWCVCVISVSCSHDQSTLQ